MQPRLLYADLPTQILISNDIIDKCRYWHYNEHIRAVAKIEHIIHKCDNENKCCFYPSSKRSDAIIRIERSDSEGENDKRNRSKMTGPFSRHMAVRTWRTKGRKECLKSSIVAALRGKMNLRNKRLNGSLIRWIWLSCRTSLKLKGCAKAGIISSIMSRRFTLCIQRSKTRSLTGWMRCMLVKCSFLAKP